MIFDSSNGGPCTDVNNRCRLKVNDSLRGGLVLLLKNNQRKSEKEQPETIFVKNQLQKFSCLLLHHYFIYTG